MTRKVIMKVVPTESCPSYSHPETTVTMLVKGTNTFELVSDSAYGRNQFIFASKTSKACKTEEQAIALARDYCNQIPGVMMGWATVEECAL